MATHSCVLAWRIPGTGEPGALLSMGLHRVGHKPNLNKAKFRFGKKRKKISIVLTFPQLYIILPESVPYE